MKRNIIKSIFTTLDRHCSVAGSAAAVFTFGMLLWGRLLMTQDIPHTAIARPKIKLAAAPTNPNHHNVYVQLHTTTDRDLFAIRTDLYESN